MKMIAKEKDAKALGSAIITNNILKMFLYILLPILLIKMLDYLYEIYDTLVISVSGIGSVKDVVVLNQIKKTISTLGLGIVTGAAILIGQLVGAKQYQKAQATLNTTFYVLLAISIVIVAIIIPFAPAFLLFIQTPQEIVLSATGYFVVQMLCVIVEIFNMLFSGIQKIKGKVSIIFYLHIGVIAIKLGLNTLFASGTIPNATVTMLAAATLAAQCFMLVFAIKSLFSKKTELHVSAPNLKFPNLKSILKISLPIFIGNFVFNYSKVFINAKLSIFYGTTVLTAFGITGTILACCQNFLTVISDAGKVVIAQNFGSNKIKRVFGAVNIAFVLSLFTTTLCFLMAVFLGPSIVKLLMQHNSAQEIEMAIEMMKIQKFEFPSILIISWLTCFTNGIGKTRYNMIINIIRTAVVRIPLMFYLYYVLHVGFQTVPLLYVISNASGAILTIILAIGPIIKLKKKNTKYSESEQAVAGVQT